MAGPAITQQDSEAAREYSRKQRWLGILDAALGLAFLIVLLATGWTKVIRDWSVRAGSQHYALELLIYVALLMVISKALTLAFDYYGYRLEHRYDLSNQKVGGWMKDEVKSFLLGFIIAAILAEIIYWLIRTSPEHWWLITWAIFIGLMIFLVQLAPVVLFPLFYKFVPLEDEELRARLVALGERAGARVRGVYEWKLSEKSKKANAALTGLGNTRRIILADTLLANYTHDEIEAVLAHELGHHVHGHIFKSIGVQIAITFLGFWAANQVLQLSVQREMFTDLHDFANLPLLVLVFTALSLLLLPVLNAFSRFNERQADAYCWKQVPAVGPFISAMNKLAEQNLSERNPSRWVEVLFHSHPAVGKRIAAAEHFAAKKS